MDRSDAVNTNENKHKYWIIVPAAGLGKRMGASVAKQYLRINKKTILELTLDRLSLLEHIEKIILVLHPEDSSWKFLNTSGYQNVVTVDGGEERHHSVLNGLNYLREEADTDDWVLVHDAVRPCVAVSDIHSLMTNLPEDASGGLLACPVKETVKRGGGSDEVLATVDRSRLWLAATPQMFRFGVLCQALEAALEQGINVTDEASAVEALGHKVQLIQGRPDNIKITEPEDLNLVEFLLKREAAQWRGGS